jgi:hypothetical protein
MYAPHMHDRDDQDTIARITNTERLHAHSQHGDGCRHVGRQGASHTPHQLGVNLLDLRRMRRRG